MEQSEYAVPILDITFFETDDILTGYSQMGEYENPNSKNNINLPIVFW